MKSPATPPDPFKDFEPDEDIDELDFETPPESAANPFESARLPHRWARNRAWRYAPWTAALLVLILSVILRPEPERIVPGRERATEAELKSLDEALDLSRKGETTAALEKIRLITARNPDVPSLDYVRALVALENGDTRDATRSADASINKGEKVSDALVLKSLAESIQSSTGSGLRDSQVVRESLLRQAIAVDPHNASAAAELANLLREQSRDGEALELLKSARLKLHPVDIHLVVETSIRLLELNRLPDDKLPEAATSGTLPEMFSSVYVLLRRNRPAEANTLLETCRKQCPPDLFQYITSDYAFSRYRGATDIKNL